MRDYREKDVEGLTCVLNPRNKATFRKETVTVRMLREDDGASLSLNVGNVMIEISLKDVEDIIKVAERRDA